MADSNTSAPAEGETTTIAAPPAEIETTKATTAGGESPEKTADAAIATTAPPATTEKETTTIAPSEGAEVTTEPPSSKEGDDKEQSLSTTESVYSDYTTLASEITIATTEEMQDSTTTCPPDEKKPRKKVIRKQKVVSIEEIARTYMYGIESTDPPKREIDFETEAADYRVNRTYVIREEHNKRLIAQRKEAECLLKIEEDLAEKGLIPITAVPLPDHVKQPPRLPIKTTRTTVFREEYSRRPPGKRAFFQNKTDSRTPDLCDKIPFITSKLGKKCKP